MKVTSVPIIDIAPFLEGDEENRRMVGKDLNKACEEIGFFLIKGHGVPQKMIDATYSKAAEFFRLPVDEKLPIRTPSQEIARGYTPFKGRRCPPGSATLLPPIVRK